MSLNTKEITLLTEDQVSGDSKLKILDDVGIICPVTDFAILLGANINENADNVFYDSSLRGRPVNYYVIPPSNSLIRIANVACDGRIEYKTPFASVDRSYGIRPVFSYNNISELPTNSQLDPLLKVISRIVEYGEYPQYVATVELQNTLEAVYKLGKLVATGKKYTTDSRARGEAGDFKKGDYIEYEYNGKKYVRVKNKCPIATLSNGKIYAYDESVWIEVSPITWYVDKESKKFISKNCLASGVRFCESGQHEYFGNFKSTEMYMFLNKYLAKDIMPSNVIINSHTMTKEEKERHERRQNPYGFSFNEVNEEEIIKGAVESDVPVFLHGRSSEGKSARIKELDSDCEIIYMRNATPDSLNGKSVYNQETGEMIDIKPSWLVKLEEKCEKEPDKIHIVFFDELTNALPSIQGMAFNIVLDREVNGKWSLPENARIAAAGNDMEDSLAANQMAEPLFNRFAHVYIKTTTEDWLKWAVTPEEDYKRLDYKEEKQPLKIHPAIYAYICMNGNALRSEYTGDKPNADPRKWEMASKVLYKTKNPQMLRALVGEDITQEFIQFCNLQAISLEDVLNDNYSEVEIQELNTAERYSTTVGLSQAKEEDIEKVRKFVMKMGPEFGAIFDALWTHGDERRLELIAEIKLGESEKENGGINNGR